MDLHKLGIKFFMTDPQAVPILDFIPVFQKWIQGQVIADHLLIDVHNYSHIHNGPGILLVAHEGNFSIDMAGGQNGLLYHRKQPGGDVVKTALQACSLLESEPSFGGRVRFRKDELEIIANDRLVAPNDEATLARLEPTLSAALRSALGQKDLKITRTSNNPKERFSARVQISPHP
jgi:hypothetical protein